MTLRDKIVEDARSLIGIRWHHQGRNLHGMDCGGMIVYICQKNGLSYYDSKGYGRRPNKEEFANHFLKGGCVPILLEDIEYGDIIVTKIKTFPSHCGVLARVMDRGGWRYTFIHAYAPYRKIIESPYDDYWKSKTWGAYRFPGMRE